MLGVLLASPTESPAASGNAPATIDEGARAFSGHIAVLPAPDLPTLAASINGRLLEEAGAAPHLLMLTPRQFAETNFFNARRFPVALYLGAESYLQTVRQPGDGDAALRNYLSSGGTLLVLPSGPFPMFYSQQGKPANGAAAIGLNIGAGSFETPPAGLRLTFRSNTNQVVFGWPETAIGFPAADEADQRWRPSRPPGNAAIRYTPWVTLFDEKGGNHGDAAALLEFAEGPLRGGRVVYVWFSLLPAEERRATALRELFRWALAGRPPRPGWLRDNFDERAGVTDDGVIWDLQAGQWRLDHGALVGQDCLSDLYEVQGATRGNGAWRDFTFSVRFRIESRGSDWRDGPWFGLHCRPDGDGYYLTFTDRDCQVHKTIYGLSTSDKNPLTRVPWKPDAAWHTLRVTTQANRMKAELDGKPFFELKDDAHGYLPSLRSGGIILAARKGSRSQGSTVVRFDDVEVRLVEAR
jgi:hypothetical protein